MKTLRRICSATILNLTFAAAVFAGQIDVYGAVSTGSTIANLVTSAVLTVVGTVY